MELKAAQDEINRISHAIETQKDEADAKRKDQREESDLEAQWQMARWAKYVGWTAWISAFVAFGALIVTGVGVYLVARTLIYSRDAARAAGEMVVEARATTKAAQDSVEEARKATKFAQATADASREALVITDRAWIKIEAELTDALVFGPETIAVSARLVFRNVGKAPATHVSTSMTLHADSLDAHRYADDRARHPMLSVRQARFTGFGVAIFPGDWHVEDNAALEILTADFKAKIAELNKWGAEADEPYSVTTAYPCILVGATYVLPGENSYRFTYMPFEIRETDRRFAGWDGGELNVPKGDLALSASFMSGLVK